MKKGLFLILGMCLFSAACATDNTGTSVVAKMKTCLTEQGWQVILDGTLYMKGMSTTAKQVSETCISQLSLQDMGIESQTTQMATTILTALSSAKQTQK